jgi:hypothetical protein
VNIQNIKLILIFSTKLHLISQFFKTENEFHCDCYHADQFLGIYLFHETNAVLITAMHYSPQTSTWCLLMLYFFTLQSWYVVTQQQENRLRCLANLEKIKGEKLL